MEFMSAREAAELQARLQQENDDLRTRVEALELQAAEQERRAREAGSEERR